MQTFTHTLIKANLLLNFISTASERRGNNEKADTSVYNYSNFPVPKVKQLAAVLC